MRDWTAEDIVSAVLLAALILGLIILVVCTCGSPRDRDEWDDDG